MIKLPVLKNVDIYRTILCQFKCWKYCFQTKMRIKTADFHGVAPSPRPPNCICNKPNLFANASLCSNSSQYEITFSQALINAAFLHLR